MTVWGIRVLVFPVVFIIAFLVIYTSAEPEHRQSVQLPSRGAWGAFEWWYAQRAQPGALIPKGAFQRAALYAKSKVRKESKLSSMPSGDTAWTSIGPANIGGRILSIAVNPGNPSEVFAGSASGGLWKSTTGGINGWTYINTGYPTLSISTLAIDQLHTDTMYMGTGEISLYHRPLIGTPGARASYGMGILKSVDGGDHWSQTSLTWTFPDITAVQKIVINPQRPRTVFAATSEGTYRTYDGGSTWTQVHNELMAMDVVMSPADTNLLIVACGNLNSTPSPGIYRSTNGGNSWTKITAGLPSTNFGRTSLSISLSNPQIVIAGISNAATGGIHGMYRSTDAGATWTLLNTTNYVFQQGWYDNVVAIHPTNPDIVFAGGLDMYRSTNGGTTLQVFPGAMHVDQHAIAFDPTNPSVIYFGNDGGMYKTTNGGTSFINLNYKLVTTQFYPGFANSPTDSGYALGGLQDNGTLRYNNDILWQTVISGVDGGWCLIDPTDPNYAYAERQHVGSTQSLYLYRSTNRGTSFSAIVSGLSNSNANFVSPIAIAPSNPTILYAGARNLYKTTNRGTSWFTSNGQSTINGTNVACIGVCPTSADTLLIGTGTGTLGATPTFEIYASYNGGTTWTNVSAGLPLRYPTDLEFDPVNTQTVYAVFSGYGTPHVFRSTNAGGSWTNISSNLPDIPMQALMVDPEYTNHLYLGTDLGVYRSTNGGAEWEEFSNGMPPAMVLDVTYSKHNQAIRASTFGNGVFQRKLARYPEAILLAPHGGEIFASGQQVHITWSQRFVGSLLIEYSTDSGATWNIAASNVSAAPLSYTWTVPELSTTKGLLRIKDQGSGVLLDQTESTFTVLFNPDILGGWNLVSLHVGVADRRTESLFPEAISPAYAFVKGYVQDDSLDPGSGYWLKFPQPQFSLVSGIPIIADTIAVTQGWNMIGTISEPVPTMNITEIPSNIITSQVFGYRSGYQQADTLIPNRGYWVKINQDGQLILSSPGAAPKQVMRRPSYTGMNSLTFSTNEGSTQTLFFAAGSAETDIGYDELPPLPPHGAFDVRFASGRIAERILSTQTRIHPINVQAPSNGLSVRWSLKEGFGPYVLDDGENEYRLSGSEGEIVLHSSPTELTLTYDGGLTNTVPTSFTLHQNYPNPFNPQTSIGFDLPQDGKVSLKIFDVLGKEVATLVNEERKAGEYSVEWKTNSGIASGIYIYRLEVYGKFTQSKKMLLVK